MSLPDPPPGVSLHRRAAPQALQIAVITVSDTRTLENDTSGQWVVDAFSTAGHSIVERLIVPDELPLIREAVQTRTTASAKLDAIILTGGTGISPRDTTPEAIEPLLDLMLPGFGELFRMLSFAEIGAASMLSRAFAGRIGGVLVFCLPGSTAAVRLAVDKLLLPELPHLVHHSRA